MQRFLCFVFFLLTVCFSCHFEARAQEPPQQQQQSKEPAKIELGVHISSFSIGPQVATFGDFQDRRGQKPVSA
jgi:hypothetical protein